VCPYFSGIYLVKIFLFPCIFQSRSLMGECLLSSLFLPTTPLSFFFPGQITNFSTGLRTCDVSSTLSTHHCFSFLTVTAYIHSEQIFPFSFFPPGSRFSDWFFFFISMPPPPPSVKRTQYSKEDSPHLPSFLSPLSALNISLVLRIRINDVLKLGAHPFLWVCLPPIKIYMDEGYPGLRVERRQDPHP